MRAIWRRQRLLCVPSSADHLSAWLQGVWLQRRGLAKKIRRKKGPVEPLAATPNSVAALLSERQVPNDMDLRELWEGVTDKKTRQFEKLYDIDSTTRFEDRPSDDSNTDSHHELLLDKASSQLTPRDVHRYYTLQKGYLQEAFREFYKFTGSNGLTDIPDRGCRALYKEIQMTGSMSLLHRDCVQRLKEMLLEEEPLKIWLDGNCGSGRSLALLSMVEWARQSNWLVLYLPSASVLLKDFFFTKRGDTEMYDTLIAAKDILKSVASIYGGSESPLASLPLTQSVPEGRDFGSSLDDLCRIGMATGDPALACDAVVGLLNELLFGDHDVQKLLVIDDYNALYWKTDYYQWKSEVHKVMIPADNITLARAFRVLEHHEAPQCHVLTAPTDSNGIAARIWIPKEEPIESFTIPRFTEDEMRCVLYHYWKQNLIEAVDGAALKRLFFVTGGNMHDLRRALAPPTDTPNMDADGLLNWQFPTADIVNGNVKQLHPMRCRGEAIFSQRISQT